MDKEIIKTIHEFVETEHIKSFYCVAFGLLPSIRLVDLTERNNSIQPELHILLNSAMDGHEKDRIKMGRRFPDIKIFYEHYEPRLYISL